MLEHTRKKRQETEEETDTFLECEQNSSHIQTNFGSSLTLSILYIIERFYPFKPFIYQNRFTILFLILALIV